MSMCWGLNMKPNRKYTQTILKSFHISGATIDEGKYAKVFLTADSTKYVIAHLDNKNCRQVPLDLNFCIGDKIMFQTSGDATISLIGYMHDGGESDDEDYEDEEYEAVAKALQKQKKDGGKPAAKESDSEENDDDDDEDDDADDSKLAAEYSSFLEEAESGEGEEEEDEDEDEDGDEDVEEDDSEAEDVAPQAKKAKLNENDKKAPNGVAKKEANKQQQQQQQQKSKKHKKADAVPELKKEQPKGKEVKAQASPNAERSITGGVKVQDIVAGSGTEAKQGKRVSVYYIGRLKSNNKTFDSMQKGNGFKFGLGAGEVIKGWDVGVVGMKVGGKRRITCPAHMAYGARGQPPTIPPNSTLVFDVELKAVH